MSNSGVENTRDDALVTAVRELTNVVKSLDNRLASDYPKRSEIERRFVSKLESRKRVIVMLLVALVTFISCYAVSIGSYAVCFTGEDNAGFCNYVPGYEERIKRREQINESDRLLELRIERLEAQLAEMRKR